MRLERMESGFKIDAADLGSLLDMAPDAVWRMMRAGSITSRFERGEGDDRGRYRLTFFSRDRRVQLVVDEAGEVLRRSRVARALPQGVAR